MFDFSSVGVADILPFVAVGFAAQIVDGALGMAFGVLTQTLLVSLLGVPPKIASASTHLVELFTTGASGGSHAFHRNVDWKLFWRLAPTGMVGGAVGAYLLSNLDASVARPFVMAYLALIGVYLGYKAIRLSQPHFKDPQYTAPLALIGGFLDAAGGGGWGPVVTSNLLVQGSDPRKTVGTVNTAEFLVTLTISATFVATLGFGAFTHAVIGLIIGGVAAAPFGAYFAKHIKPRFLLGAVSIVLISTSVFSIVRAWPIF